MTTERIIAQCLACNHKEELPDKPSGPFDCPKCGYTTSVYTSRQMSPEEIAAKYGPPNPVKRKVNRQTIKFTLPHLEARQAKEVQPMTQTAENREPFVPDKVEFLRQIAAGKSISKVERTWNMSPGSLHYWVGKWNLKGIKPERAQQLLDEMALDGQAQAAPAEQEQSDDQVEITRLREELAKAIGERNQFRELYGQVEEENQKLREQNERHMRGLEIEEAENKSLREEVERVRTERDEWHRAVIDLEGKIDDYSFGILEQDREISRLRQEITELNSDRQVLLATIENASAEHDPVNHPAHYTAGKVECIDAIESATTGLVGGAAYCTGAAIKYLWRWSRKGGLEDLLKARWYIDRLITEFQNHKQIS